VSLDKLSVLFEGLVPPEIIQTFWDSNSHIRDEELRYAKTGYELANWALLRLESVKVGELTVDQKLKRTALENLKEEFRQKYEKLSQKASYVFYLDTKL